MSISSLKTEPLGELAQSHTERKLKHQTCN